MLQTRDIDVDSVRNWKFCRSVLVSLPIKKMNLFLHMLAAMALQYGTVKVNGQKYVLTSSCVGVVTEGSSCVLTCETGDATETPIAWTRGANAPYEVDRATCTKSTPSVPSDYVLACPGTSFTLNITAASVTQDKTTWICDAVLGGKDSNITHLDVQALDTTTTTSRTTAAPVPCDSDCAWYAVIILVVLLVVKIVTDGIFVGYRWGDKCKQIIDKKRHILYWICFVQGIINSICGVVFIIIICLAYPKCLKEALAIAALVISIIVLITGLIYIVMFLCIFFSCKQITDTDRQRHILYWICFVQGIINSICGVTFFIVICLAYPKCLEECLPIAVLVLCIIVLITGVINIVMCLCCCCCPQSSDPGKPETSGTSGKPETCGMCEKPDNPSPWLRCCCGTVHPENESSTTPRTLPSPTSDPASDSAVNPTVHLEPLSVEEPKKKKKKRKKRKNINEARGETSDQLKNPAGDSDE